MALNTNNEAQVTYASAGVDVEAGDRAVELMKASVTASQKGHPVLGGTGGFAGMYDATSITTAGAGMREPVLATSTDGVGTKVAIAQAIDKHDTIGFDLVGMVVDDIAVTGAKPLFMTDYICCGHVVPERVADIVRGIAEACTVAETALVGGETAEHPGLLEPDEYDVAGAATGIIEKSEVLTPDNVAAGDVLIAMPSSGLHSNGFSLVRAVFAAAKIGYKDFVDEFGSTLGEHLLTPTKVYSAECLRLKALLNADGKKDLRIFSHVTGGGLASNLARVLPKGLTGVIERGSWSPAAVFNVVQTLGNVPQLDLEKTLNMGIGMIAVVSADAAPAALALLEGSFVCGFVTADDVADAVSGTKGVDGGSALLTGAYK